MPQSRRTRRKMQEWVRAKLEKHGCVKVDTTTEMLEKRHQLEEYIDGQIA
jgi:RNA-binding protein YhbY